VFHLEGQSVGRFNHVRDNLKLFFERWGKSFDAQMHFIESKPTKTILPKCSLFKAADSCSGEKPMAVAWEGTFLDFGSLSYVNRQLTKLLAVQPGIELSRVGKSTLIGSAGACSELQELAGVLKLQSGKETQITVRHQWPPNWSRPKQGAFVVIQPWEFGALPQEWVKASAQVDEFWVPSNYVRQVYVDSGIAPGKVFVVPNGVDAEIYRMGAKPLALATQKKFRFLSVGGTIHRKGPDVLLEAYLKNFTAQDDVCLVIKDFGGQSWYGGQTFENQIKAAQLRPDAPEILYLTEELSADAMPGLYAACDCLVHPYRGEGFGLPVLEAMACGLPVIVTGGGATDDFADDEHAYRIASRRKDIGSEISGQKLARIGWLLEPDLPALATRMKWVVNHPEEARRKGHAASDHARQRWTWQHAARIVRDRLHALRARNPVPPKASTPPRPRQSSAIKLPETAKIGQLVEAREMLGRKEWARAWQSTLAALTRRPYHPEAYLLLAEIAQKAGDVESSRLCAKAARDMALSWSPPKQFLRGNLRGNSKPEWLTLPPNLPAPRVSVCLITKNEEAFLPQCLRSVRALASQIVVVDTGSTDRTIDIAKEFGAEVHSFAWCDDFSAARNAALEHATGDWVLIIDADEELMPEQAEVIAREIRAATVMGYRLPIIERGHEQEGCSYVPRLFRNAPGLFFVGRIHEQVFSSIQVRCQQWGLKHQLGKTALLHHGYTGEVMASRNKIERNLRLLEQAVEEMPEEPNLIMSLGLELVRSGKLEAGLERYWEAFRLLSALPATEVTPELRETLLTHLTTHLMAAKRFSDIVQLWEVPFAKNGGLTASQHFGLGLAHVQLQQPAEAAEQLRQCLASRNRTALCPVNPEILKAGPHHCLALCLIALKDVEGAQQAFDAALAEDTASRPLRFDLARFHAAQGRTDQALTVLRQLATEDPSESRVWECGGQIALNRPEHLEFACDWTADAVKTFPADPGLLSQRAEALLLSQDVAQALPLWRNATHGSPRQRAAVVLCELLTGDRQHHFTAAEEPALSQEVLQWYRHCIRMGAHSLIHQLHERMETIRLTLPSFVRVCEAAHRQARLAAA
jgi:glycosyltransferase involved in cell wall biosynthesis/tetratricopeptide (TPR) repeat protein